MKKPKPIYLRKIKRLVDFPIAEEIMIEEFEKIKEELLDESYHMSEDDDFDSGKIIVEWEDIDRIFNKHISELKEK